MVLGTMGIEFFLEEDNKRPRRKLLNIITNNLCGQFCLPFRSTEVVATNGVSTLTDTGHREGCSDAGNWESTWISGGAPRARSDFFEELSVRLLWVEAGLGLHGYFGESQALKLMDFDIAGRRKLIAPREVYHSFVAVSCHIYDDILEILDMYVAGSEVEYSNTLNK